jgi:hypothetical protein
LIFQGFSESIPQDFRLLVGDILFAHTALDNQQSHADSKRIPSLPAKRCRLLRDFEWSEGISRGGMDMTELFEQMESAYRSSIPWPWPRTMTDAEVETISLVTGTPFLDGVFVYGEPRLRYDGTIKYFSIEVKI